jgi:hypothetical protein
VRSSDRSSPRSDDPLHDVGALLILAASVATAFFAAVSLRFASLVSTILAAYLAFVAEAVIVVIGLLLFRDVHTGPVAITQLVLLAVSVVCWLWRGRPGLPIGSVVEPARELRRSPVAVLFVFVAAVGFDQALCGPSVPRGACDPARGYGSSRRLGFDVRVSACSAALLATFSLVALEAMTAQNDLVAASFPVIALCLLLGRTRGEAVLAGAALCTGLGAS